MTYKKGRKIKSIIANVRRIEKLASYLASDFNDRNLYDDVDCDDDGEVAEKILVEVAKIKRLYKL